MTDRPERYVCLVENHWLVYLPGRVSQMDDPVGFFTVQARILDERVAELMTGLGASEAARSLAEFIAYAEILPIPDSARESARSRVPTPIGSRAR